MKNIFEAFKIVKDKQIDALRMPSLPKEFILKSISDSNINPRIVTHFYPKSPIAEQYYRLRESIKSKMQKESFKTIAITSAVNGEGKSITSLNLAVAMTKDVDCKKVLLIDCDLRRGRIDHSLGLNSNVGLSEYLMLGTEINNILFKTKINKLTIIPRGKIADNPSELLSSEKMKKLLGELKKQFDVIIVDMPPLIPIADASIVCAQSDMVLMAVRAGKTQRGVVDHAAEFLAQAEANLIGYVLTHVEYYIPAYIYQYV
ncbi:MAG: CpsD/CapB family tyrosine-protein kinase [Candidatus Omnitrophica bacterium]|nr:CpsD/CapB family tyrosine-protein kinase [Candidatus Omnitrophota bacterium]MBU4479170.1 CpsD/CapB family tyrosine-protein kinase [Candidatus Omnitrophota bacterium]MCG2703980.1 CpsD/CapB family tyrosine-protein kinase [Candidatus Omnitrophota bacterium]